LEKSRLGSKEKKGSKNKLAEGDSGATKDSTTGVWGAVPEPS